MKNKLTKKLRMMLLAALVLLMTIPAVAMAGAEDRAEMSAYWKAVGTQDGSALARAMNGEAVALVELTAVTADELMAFAHANQLPIDMARHGWYDAIVAAMNVQGTDDATLSLFLSMPETWRDSAANTERRSIRRGVTEADVRRISEQNGLPGGFVAWLLLEDEWHEGDWEDVSEWREGRSGWRFADHAYAADMRDRYGKSHVVTDDDVERVLRQKGLQYDD